MFEYLEIFLQQLRLIIQNGRKQRNDKSLLIIGNGPSSISLCPKKIKHLLENEKIEVSVVNGFFSQNIFDIGDLAGINYFYMDTQIIDFMTLSREDIANALNEKIRSESNEQRKKILDTYVRDSIFGDIESLNCALNRKLTNCYFHPKLRSHINRSAKSVYILRKYKVLRPALFLISVVMRKNYHGLYFGNNVISYAIMHGIEKGFDKVYVIGHAESLKYRIRGDGWSLKYSYFYSNDDVWYDRNEEISEFGKEYLRTRLNEYKFPTAIRRKVRFLGDQHHHFALCAESDENKLFMKE
jgi:hypothetical protein